MTTMTVSGAGAPLPAPSPKILKKQYLCHFRLIWPKFGPKLDLRILPIPAATPSKWRPFNNSVIFWPICFKFGKKVDPRMGNDVVTPPQRYGAVRGAAAPFPAAPPLKWRPFNNSVIFRPICFEFG